MRRARETHASWMPVLQVLGVVLVVVVGRRFGVPEDVAAASLAGGATAVLVVHAARRVRSGGGGRLLTVAFASAVAAASMVPALRSMLPGRPIVSAVPEHEGNSVALPPGSVGPVRLLVSSELPEDRSAYIGFSLVLGAERVEGALEHGVRRWGAGEDVRRYHVERPSVYFDARVAPGAKSLLLARLSSALPSALRVDVYRRIIPSWIFLLLALLALSFAGFVDALAGGRGRVGFTSGAALASGLLAGWTATPEQALWPCMVSLAFGTLIGGAGGRATSRAAKWLRRTFRP